MAATARIRGYTELLAALKLMPKEVNVGVRTELRGIGETVRADASDLFNKYSPKSAGGYRVRVRQRGVAVEQSLRKTTGRRPDYGALQMRQALIPALEQHEEQTYERLQAVVTAAATRLGF